MNVKLLIIILDREGLVLDAKMDRARVRLERINVDKEKDQNCKMSSNSGTNHGKDQST
jgi:hypothetical protein